MYNNNMIIWGHEVIAPIPNSMIPVGFFPKNKYVINLTTDDMIYKFEVYVDHNMDVLYLT